MVPDRTGGLQFEPLMGLEALSDTRPAPLELRDLQHSILEAKVGRSVQGQGSKSQGRWVQG